MKFSTKIKSGKCIVFFWSSWCGPCHDLSSLKKIKTNNKDIKVILVNIEEQPEISNEYSILIVPTYIFFQDSIPINYAFGIQTFDSLSEIIKKSYF